MLGMSSNDSAVNIARKLRWGNLLISCAYGALFELSYRVSEHDFEIQDLAFFRFNI